MSEKEIIEKIEALPDDCKIRINSDYNIRGFIPVDDLKRLARELTETKADLDKMIEHYGDSEQWLCPFDRKLCQDDDCYHDRFWLSDDDGNGYDFARQIAAKREKQNEK